MQWGNMLIWKEKDGSLSVSQSWKLSRCVEYIEETLLNAAGNSDPNNKDIQSNKRYWLD